MNIKLKLLATVIVLAVTVLCLVTCNDVPEHEHQYTSDWSYDETNHWHAASCENGDDCLTAIAELSEHAIVDGVCSVCGYEPPVTDGGDNADDGETNTDHSDNTDNNNGSEDGEPVCTEHQYACELTKEPTCTENGENTFTCGICGDSYTGSVAPNGHTEATIAGKKPTCTEPGLSNGKECSVCGEITKAQNEIGATGHSFADGICTSCGEADQDYIDPDANTIHTATTDNNCWVDKVSFTAAESGEYTFYLPAGLGAWDADDHASGKPGPVVDSLHPNYAAEERSFTVPIASGAVYEFYIAAANRQDWSISWSFVPGEVQVGGDDDSDTDRLPLTIGTNVINAESVVYTYTAPSEGTLTLSAGSAISGAVEISYTVNGGESLTLELESAVALTLAEGDAVLITLIADGYSSLDAAWDGESAVDPDEGNDGPSVDISGEYIGTDAFGNKLLTVIIDSVAGTVVFDYYHPLTGPNTVNATYKIKDGEITLYDESGNPLHPLSGTLTIVDGVPSTASYNGTEYSLALGSPEDDNGTGDDGEIKVIKGIMTDEEENTFSVTADDLSIDKMYVTFLPVNDGVYDFFSDHIFVSAITAEDGTPAGQDMYGLYILESYVKYIVEINLEYVFTVGDYTITPAYQYPKGHPNNPFWYTLEEPATATYNGDYRPVWYQFYANMTGTLTVSTETQGVTVMIAAVSNFDISAVETISLDVVQGRKYYIGVAAYDSTDAVDIEFTASITEGEITTDGSINYPYNITLGENTAEVEAASGMYFIYKSTGNGTLTLSPDSAGFTWCFTDFTEPAYTSDGDISVHLYIGDIVYLYVEADADISDPVSFTASFSDDAKETWVGGPFVLDGSVANEIVIEENTYALFRISGTVGQFTVSWDNADAVVAVNDEPIESGDVIEVTSPWFGPYIKVYLSEYSAGTVNLTITQIEPS